MITSEEVVRYAVANTLSVSPGPYRRILELEVQKELVFRRFYLGFQFDSGSTDGIFQAKVTLFNKREQVGELTYQWAATSAAASANGVVFSSQTPQAPPCSAHFTEDTAAPSSPMQEPPNAEELVCTRRDGVVSQAGVWTVRMLPIRLTVECTKIVVEAFATYTDAAATDGWAVFAGCRSTKLAF